MSTEIATWNMIRSKIPTFPSPTDGRGNECLTKAEIQSLGGESLSIEGNYGNNECVILDHIAKVTWEYYFSVTPASLSFTALGGTQSVSIISYKEQYIGGVPSGTRVNVGFISSSSSSWLSSTGTSVTVQENTTTSKRTGTITYTQQESGNPARVEVEQREAEITGRYVISADPYEIYDSITYSGGRRIAIISKYNEYLNGNLLSSKNIDWKLRESTNGAISETLSAYSSSRKFRYTASKVNAGEGCEIYYEKCTNDIGADFATFQIVQNQSNAYTIIELTITFN